MTLAVRALDANAIRAPLPKKPLQPSKLQPESPKDVKRDERIDEQRRLARIRADEIC